MKILFASSEVYPFSKTGGLADIAGFLPLELYNIGLEVVVISPLYKNININISKLKYIGSSNILMNHLNKRVNYLLYEENNIKYIFTQNDEYFNRDNYYGYDDDFFRFLFFSYSVLDVINILNINFDLIHLNDWQSAPVSYLLDEHYRYKINGYKNIHTLLTIHNLGYQGIFNKEYYKYLNNEFDYTYIHFDSINFLKTGIMRSTKINTVSPNYKLETLKSDYSFTLDGALLNRGDDYIGILNGIDENTFNTKTDPYLNYNYSINNYLVGKRKNKEYLFNKYNISLNNLNKPLISYIGRLADQKGLDILMPAIKDLLTYSNALFFILGSGENKYINEINYLKNKFPNQVLTYIGYNESLAHLVYASSDLFVMPSKFEPCGLGQMISMKYATLPVVRETGGLKDSVTPYNKYQMTGNGFSFKNYNSNELKDKLYEAVNLYNNNYNAFKKLMRNAYKTNFSINNMALKYKKLYEKILKG